MRQAEVGKRELGRIVRTLCALVAALVLAFSLAMPALAEGEDTSEGQQPELIITVEEEIPAAEIEYDAVPLSAGPAERSAIELPQVVLMGVAFVASVGYALYFRAQDQRLYELRRTVAEAEGRLVSRRRE